jgi:broad specificity phosphatase PhoE
MKTTLYLLRHGATAANLLKPPTLQGQRINSPLADVGVRQAELTRDFLAIRPLDGCYCSPLARAVETARIISRPHGMAPVPRDALIECDVGKWEGLDWPTIRTTEPEAYQRFMNNPARFGYPGGESFADVARRVTAELDDLFSRHKGDCILVVSHHVVNRVYLAHLLGLPPERARQVALDNCGISIVVCEDGRTRVTTLNATFHLQGVAA